MNDIDKILVILSQAYEYHKPFMKPCKVLTLDQWNEILRLLGEAKEVYHRMESLEK